MKTLDELIKAEEICSQIDADCSKCPYKATAKGWCEEKDRDALAYLKAYRDDRNDLTALRAYWAEQQANPPLTWEELNCMNGKPVWVEALLYKQWAVIAYVGSDHIRFEGANLYAPESRVYMGEANGWRAYRKERE